MLITYSTIIVIYCYVFLSFCFSWKDRKYARIILIIAEYLLDLFVLFIVIAYICLTFPGLWLHKNMNMSNASCHVLVDVSSCFAWILDWCGNNGSPPRRCQSLPSRHVTPSRCETQPRTMLNVGKTRMNYPPNHNFYRWYKHWQMGGLFLFYPHYRYLKSSAIRPCFNWCVSRTWPPPSYELLPSRFALELEFARVIFAMETWTTKIEGSTFLCWFSC